MEVQTHARALGLDSEIRKFIEGGGIYVGRSAGAIIIGPELDEAFFDYVNDIGMNDLSGFGYYDFYMVVHWETKTGGQLTDMIKHSWNTGKHIIPLTDQQAVLVTDEGFKII